MLTLWQVNLTQHHLYRPDWVVPACTQSLQYLVGVVGAVMSLQTSCKDFLKNSNYGSHSQQIPSQFSVAIPTPGCFCTSRCMVSWMPRRNDFLRPHEDFGIFNGYHIQWTHIFGFCMNQQKLAVQPPNYVDFCACTSMTCLVVATHSLRPISTLRSSSRSPSTSEHGRKTSTLSTVAPK